MLTPPAPPGFQYIYAMSGPGDDSPDPANVVY